MISIALILGVSILLGATLIVKYWNKVIEVMKRAIYKLQTMVEGVLVGSAVFIRKVGEKFQNRTKHYSRTNLGKWEETIVTYELEENEVPDEYKNYAVLDNEYDLTKELELQLKESR